MLQREAVGHQFGVQATVDSQHVLGRITALSTSPALRTSMLALLTAASYYAGSRIGFFFTPAETPIAMFWPPNAILLVVFLLTPRRTWWVLVLAVLPAHLLIQLQVGIPVLSALGWFAGNSGEALLGAACIRFLRKEQPWFDSVHGVVVFLAFGVGLATLVTSFLDAGSTLLTGLGRNYWMLWTTRLTSNMVADLTIVPTLVILATSKISRFRKAKIPRYFEGTLLAVAIVTVSVFVFRTENAPGSIPAFIYAPLPFFIWAALRFGAGALSASMLVTTLISVWNAMHGRGPFGTSSPVAQALSLHIVLTVFAVPLMLMAALIAERRSIGERLKAAREKLMFERDEELHRVARGLHEDIVQPLTLAGLSVESLRARSDSSAKVALGGLYDQISNLSEVTRNLSQELYPFTVEYLGLVPALRKLCRKVGGESGIAITFSEEAMLPDLSSDFSQSLFRVAQQVMQEIVRQSHAKTADMGLKVTRQRVLLQIKYDGGAISPEQWEGTALTWVRERLLSMGGTLRITSVPSGGAIIEALVPIKPSPQFRVSDCA